MATRTSPHDHRCRGGSRNQQYRRHRSHLVVVFVATFSQLSNTSAQSDTSATNSDYFCGTNWPDAALNCHAPCPPNDDAHCSSLFGDDYECYGFTGCKDKLPDESDENADNSVVDEEAATSSDPSINNFCGKSWLGAMLTCNDPCPLGTECDTLSGDRCFAATNCDKPMAELVSDLMVTMMGPEAEMDSTDGDIFGGTIYDILAEVAEQEGIALAGLDLTGQAVADTRMLQERQDRRMLKLGITNVTQRMLPSGSSALDVSMVVTGDYRPPPYLDLDVIAEDSINRDGAKVVGTLRERGERAGRTFFDRVSGIEAVAKESITARPTRSPSAKPTPGELCFKVCCGGLFVWHSCVLTNLVSRLLFFFSGPTGPPTVSKGGCGMT